MHTLKHAPEFGVNLKSQVVAKPVFKSGGLFLVFGDLSLPLLNTRHGDWRKCPSVD